MWNILKLRRCRISGFKALRNVSLAIPNDLLILIGNNGAGKSSTLQALGFMRDFAEGTPESFFESRGWSRRDVRSQVSGRGTTLRFDLLFDIPESRRLLWQISWGLTSGSTRREILWISENDRLEPRRILAYGDNAVTSDLDGGLSMRGLTLKGSLLSVVEADRASPVRSLLKDVAAWAGGVISLELLSPEAMRRGTRGRATSIGSRGEHLASFLANLPASAKARIVNRLSRFYPLDDIDTTRKRAGWVDLRIAERFGMGAIGAAQVSDGFLRLLALCAIPEFGTAVSLVLLDEVEDGIEPHILPDLIQQVIADTPAQFVMTSHSPLLINFFEPRDVALIGRRQDGSALTASLDQLPTVRTGLEYFGGGEIWANMASQTLGRELAGAAGPSNEIVPSRFDRSNVRAFMSGGGGGHP